jgi:hypothetical protein
MANGEAWETIEKIHAAQARFESQMPGWVGPAAYGVLLVEHDQIDSSEVRFPHVNLGSYHALPAVVMGLLTGRVDETATFEVSAGQLDQAIDMLAPAEAATQFEHPNIESWRAMRDRHKEDSSTRIFVVFVADFDDPTSGPYDKALRAQIAAEPPVTPSH